MCVCIYVLEIVTQQCTGDHTCMCVCMYASCNVCVYVFMFYKWKPGGWEAAMAEMEIRQCTGDHTSTLISIMIVFFLVKKKLY